MRLDRYTIIWLTKEGWTTLIGLMLNGLAWQLANNWDGEDLEFEACCKDWTEILKKNTRESLIAVCEDMNKQAGDMFGTEGWEKGLGIPT